MDGVLVDWLNGLRKAGGLPESIFDGFRADPSILNSRNISSSFGSREVVDKLMDASYPEFWINLEIFPWADFLVTELKNNFDVVFVTSPGGCEAACQGKWAWKKLFYPGTSMIITRDKFLAASETKILVDDDDFQLNKFAEAGGFAIKWANQFYMEKLSLDEIKVEIGRLIKVIKEYEKQLNL